MNTVNLKINNIPVVAPEGATILEAAHLVGIRIPTLCYLKEINAIGGYYAFSKELINGNTAWI